MSDAGWEQRLDDLGQAQERADGLRGIHTSCDKWLRVERGEYGTKLYLTEPERGLLASEKTMWANLSPRAVEQLIAALIRATWDTP